MRDHSDLKLYCWSQRFWVDWEWGWKDWIKSEVIQKHPKETKPPNIPYILHPIAYKYLRKHCGLKFYCCSPWFCGNSHQIVKKCEVKSFWCSEKYRQVILMVRKDSVIRWLFNLPYWLHVAKIVHFQAIFGLEM